MPNFALDAIRGYRAVDDIFRQDRLDKQAVEDRKIFLEDRERNKKRQERYDTRQDTMWGREDQAYADQQTLRDLDVAETEMIFGKEVTQNPQAMLKISGMVKDPNRVGEIIALNEEVSQYLSSGKTPPQDVLVKLVNLTGAEELQARGGNDGLSRKVRAIVPSNVPGEVMIEFEVTGKDGKTYNAPMTTGASADPSDNIVQSIPVSKLVEWVGGATMTAKTLAIARAKAGDTSFLQAHKAAIAAQQARAQAMSDYEQKKIIDQRYQKPQGPVAAGKYGMFHNGKFIPNPMTEGLGEYETITDPETGEETIVRSSKGYKAKGKQRVNYNDDDRSFSVYDEGTGEAKIVYPAQIADKMADDQAELWAQQQAEGMFNTRPSDEEIQAKRNEIRASIPTGPTGGQQGQPGGGGTQSSGSTQFAPGQILIQNGVEYIVDANGVPQANSAGQNQQTSASSEGQRGTAQAAVGQNAIGQNAPAVGQNTPDRMLELDQQRAGRSGPVVSDDLKETVKALPAAFKNTAQVGLDIYQSLVGQPFLDALKMLKTGQQKQAALFTVEQRYKNGTISTDEYKKAVEILEGK